MIKRHYFIRVESHPHLRKKRMAEGKVILCTGVYTTRSFLSCIHSRLKDTLESVANPELDFNVGQIILTYVRRI